MGVNLPNGGIGGKQVDHYPDACPICHHASEPKFLIAFAPADDFIQFDAAFKCPRKACGHLFLATYRTGTGTLSAYLDKTAPVTATPGQYAEEIKKLSPTFVAVSDQVRTAEAAGLDQLAGIGLRKALEFLVKDFAIYRAKAESAEDKDKIRGMKLGAVIDKYVDDPKVKDAVKRATWLGNDETHYLRKWEAKDITDLKNLIRIAVNDVADILLLEDYVTTMPEGEKH